MNAVLNWDKVLMAFAAALALGISALATVIAACGMPLGPSVSSSVRSTMIT